MEKFEEILNFWFGHPHETDYGKPKPAWFMNNSIFDEQIRTNFLTTYELAATNQLDSWQNSPLSCLALIITLDQFPRNLFRGKPQAFATDEQALKIAKYALNQRYDQQMIMVQRAFIYLPLEHSENLADQTRSVKLFETLKPDPNTASMFDYAIAHYKIIQKFGRFPHRNAILNRPCTPAEQEFLTQPNSSF